MNRFSSLTTLSTLPNITVASPCLVSPVYNFWTVAKSVSWLYRLTSERAKTYGPRGRRVSAQDVTVP